MFRPPPSGDSGSVGASSCASPISIGPGTAAAAASRPPAAATKAAWCSTTWGKLSGRARASTEANTTSGNDRPAASALGPKAPTNACAAPAGASRKPVGASGSVVPSVRRVSTAS